MGWGEEGLNLYGSELYKLQCDVYFVYYLIWSISYDVCSYLIFVTCLMECLIDEQAGNIDTDKDFI